MWWCLCLGRVAAFRSFSILAENTFCRGCLHLLISKWHWLQKPKFGCLHLLRVSLDRQVSLTFGCLHLFWHWSGCLHLLIRVSLTLVSLHLLIRMSLLLISKWHWLQKPKTVGCLHQKPKFQLSGGGVVSTIWSASDTGCFDFGFLHPLTAKTSKT